MSAVPESSRTARVSGYLDGFEGTYVVGWARSEESEKPCLISVRDQNGAQIVEGEASRPRPDLEVLGLGRSDFAFRIHIPELGTRVVLRVFADDVELRGSPLPVGNGHFDGRVYVQDGFATGWVTERLQVFSPPQIDIVGPAGEIIASAPSERDANDGEPGFSPARFRIPLTPLFGSADIKIAAFAKGVRFAQASCSLRLIDKSLLQDEPDASPTVDGLSEEDDAQDIAIADTIRTEMDDEFYVRQLHQHAVELPPEPDYALHYVQIGARLGLDPNEQFSTLHYLRANNDVAKARVNPFWHFVVAGRLEGREPLRSAVRSMSEPNPSTGSNISSDQLDLMVNEFDADFYKAANPDVAAAGVDPLTHFACTGWREGRNPNRSFSVKDYLGAYPDVEEAGINPFLHFLAQGRAEGRVPRYELGFRFEVLKNLRGLDDSIAWTKSYFNVHPGDSARALTKRIRAALKRSRGFFLTVSHDDFTQNVGGVQLCLMRESQRMSVSGWTHLHLFPNVPLPIPAPMDEPVRLGVLLNGKRVGVYTPEVIEEVFRAVMPAAGMRRIVIHSLLGHRVDAIVKIAKAASIASGLFWVHDFASICAGLNLMRNDVEYCGAPPADSGACLVCRYSTHRSFNVHAHQVLFDSLDLTAVAPSNSALAIFQKNCRRQVVTRVHEHCRLVAGTPKPARSRDQPLRIAFLGHPAPHKGWFVFRQMAIQFAGSENIEFVHFGKNRDVEAPVEFHSVAVTPRHPTAMIDAVRSHEVDIAFIWSLWPETFCFTAYEAMAGGAAVYTNPESGNVARLVQSTGIGRLFRDESALTKFLSTAPLDDLENHLCRQWYALEYSDMSADLLEPALIEPALP